VIIAKTMSEYAKLE